MEKELECIKIKDGLYLGNVKTSQDAQFLVTNKFAYIVNCSAEIANFYEGQGIKYLKFKLIRDKPHKLWDETLKKLKKLDKFIQTCQQNSLCCLIHSYDGINRSLVMLVAFLMNRFKWTLGKTLEFVRSKDIFIGLSEHYIQQLQILQQILSATQPLSSQWRIQYKTIQEEIVSKTFLNSQQIESKQIVKKQKKNKRVVWKDLVEKQKKKQQKLLIKQQQKERGIKIISNIQQKPIIDLAKVESKQVLQKKKAKSEQTVKKQVLGLKRPKINGNKSRSQILLHETEQRSLQKYKQKQKYPQYQQFCQPQLQPNLNQAQILSLIKTNIRQKKSKLPQEPEANNNQSQQRIYNVTINNYIKPNINILNNVPGDKKKGQKKRPQSAWKKNRPL